MESQTGSGSHFWIDVPFMLADQQLQDESAMASNIIAFADPFVRQRARVRPLRVLVADDHSANLLLLRRLLRQPGHRRRRVDACEAVPPPITNPSCSTVLPNIHLP